MSEAGMQTSRMSFSSMPLPPSRSVLMTAAVAADMGLPVMPSEAAIVATVMGRSGRILLSLAISEMMGSSEYDVWAVPATRQKIHVVSGP